MSVVVVRQVTPTFAIVQLLKLPAHYALLFFVAILAIFEAVYHRTGTFFENLRGDETAVAGGVAGLVMTVGIAAVIIVLMLYIFASITTKMPSTGCNTADQKIDNVESTTYDAFDMATVLLFVVIGGGMIGVLLKIFVFK
jgi:hypothetical protein